MSEIKRIPNVIVQTFIIGSSISGVEPTGEGYSFDFDNNVGTNFTVDEALTWTGGTGYLISIVDSGLTGNMVISLDTGVAPSDGLTITGSSSGATCDVDGIVTYEGVLDSNESIRRGRYRQFSGLSDGGLVNILEDDAWNGFKIRSVLMSVPGITAVDFFITDRQSHDIFSGSASISSGNAYHDWRDLGLLVAPGCSFKIVGTGNLSSFGKIMIILDRGWASDVFDSAIQLGRDNRPPGMVRT